MRKRAAVVVAVALLLAGCDGSTEGSGTPTGRTLTPPSAEPTAASETFGPKVTRPDGVVHRTLAPGVHTDEPVDYPDSPPLGGPHNPVWLDCSGTVYTDPVPNENAVHSLEHGAVWITYRPDLDADGVATLRKLADGQNYTFLSPYPGLDQAVSVQSWGYQLKVEDPSSPLITQFIRIYRQNRDTTPELNASCVKPEFG